MINENNRLRQSKWRNKNKSNAESNKEITPPSSSSSSSSSSKQRKTDRAKARPNDNISDKFETDIVGKIKSKCENVIKICSSKKAKLNVYQWVQFWANKNAHPLAVIDSLDGFSQRILDGDKEPILNPWSYLDTIMKTKNRNYHEADNRKKGRKFKDMAINQKLLELIKGL